MSLLQPAVSSSAFLKMGLLGFQGGGKTLTAAKTAIGLIKHLKAMGITYANKPVAMFDTETGSDWLIPLFKEAGIPLVVAKRSAFADLIKVMDEAEQHASALIIDSITHPWRELCQSYMRKKQRTYLTMDDWGYLKGEHGWKQFTDRFINSKLHIIMCGRAGYEYENYEEDGRKKMEKVGTKMKTEGETGFEPSLLVLMEQVEDMRTNKVVHRATVQKDRSTLLDGTQIDNPDFNDFLPHIQCLALGGDHLGVNEGDSQSMLKTEKRDWQPVQRKIVHDEIQTLLVLHYPGQTAEHKTSKLKLLLKHFDASWTEIEEVMTLDKLRKGYDSLYRELEQKPSRYAEYVAALTAEIRDEIPNFDAPAIAASANAGASEPARISLKDQLLADIDQLNSQADCVHFGIELSNLTGLSTEAFNEVNKKLLARQNAIAKGPDKGKDEGGDDEDLPEKPNDGAPGQMPPPAQSPGEQRPAARNSKAKDKQSAPVEAERSMADLASA